MNNISSNWDSSKTEEENLVSKAADIRALIYDHFPDAWAEMASCPYSVLSYAEDYIKEAQEVVLFYAERANWKYSGDDRFDCNISFSDASEVITGKQRDKVGGKRAREFLKKTP